MFKKRTTKDRLGVKESFLFLEPLGNAEYKCLITDTQVESFIQVQTGCLGRENLSWERKPNDGLIGRHDGSLAPFLRSTQDPL